MITDATRLLLSENWKRTQDSVLDALNKAKRPAESVQIIGVSKYVDVEVTAALFDVGCTHLGESRPQQLGEKASAWEALPHDRSRVHWHMIGNLQRNKAKRVVEVADMIHSIDSARLLSTVQQYALQLARSPKLLIEVKISGEVDKHGFAPDQLRSCWAELIATQSPPIIGLMAMAGLEAKADEARRQFASLRELRDELESKHGAVLPELSMGMSGDFVEAILEGATMVRIGSRLFEGIR